MIPIVSVVGKSNSGKTTLVEKLLPALIKRGYRVATVKHHNGPFEIDKSGKDSWRHRQAGAYSTIIGSPEKIAVIRTVDRDLPLSEIRDRFVGDVDLLLAEGFKQQPVPKIEIFRSAVHAEPLCCADDHLIAMVSDKHFDLPVPCCGLDDIKQLVDIIEAKVIAVRKQEIVLRVNGERIPLKPFIDAFMRNALQGMILSLKGCENPRKIEIVIE